MTEQSRLEPNSLTTPPTSSNGMGQKSQTLSTAPKSAIIPADLGQTEQEASLARQHAPPTTAVLVFVVFLLLAMVSVISWALLHRLSVDLNTGSDQAQRYQTTPATHIAGLAGTDAAAAAMLPTPPAITSSSMITPSELSEPPSWMVEAETMYRNALHAGNYIAMEHVLTLLAAVRATDPQSSEAVSSLQSQAAYARDVLTGTVYLTANNMTRWQLVDSDGYPLFYPIDMTITDSSLYFIDSGSLYQGELDALPVGGGVMTTTAILTPLQLISGFPIKEIVAVDGSAYHDAVFVLDKSTDIYRFQPSNNQWSLELPLAHKYQDPDPFYQNLTTYNERLYMLDPARNQIWRHSDTYIEPEYLTSKFPWLLDPGDPDVSSGLDLAIDGNIYVLSRGGSINTYNNGLPSMRFSVPTADERSLVAGLQTAPSQPVALAISADGVTLYVVDPGQRRVVALDRRDGQLLRQFIAPDNLDFTYLHAVVEHGNQLFLMAASRLYAIDLSGGVTTIAPLSDQLPLWVPFPATDHSRPLPIGMTPNDPRLTSIIASYGFVMPIQGALLPDRGAIYPGSRRAYRYGVHEGLDIYGRDVGVDLVVGTPVVAVGDGVIMRADTNYQELSPQALNAILDDAHVRHDTPRDALDKLGGRQVWINHGGGVVTVYAHLSRIGDGITVGQPVRAGQVIGAVGVSGTPDGAAGVTQFAHLHFEIRLGDEQQYYLGQWLSIEETRRAFEQVFQVPIRPAYLEFRR